VCEFVPGAVYKANERGVFALARGGIAKMKVVIMFEKPRSRSNNDGVNIVWVTALSETNGKGTNK
jgi:hypothetical protein